MSGIQDVKARMEAASARRLEEERKAAAAEGVVSDLEVAKGVSLENNKTPLKDIPEPMLENIRIFRSRVPGSSFVMKEGYTIYFTKGWFETSDPSEIAQLDAVANKTPTIYTDEHEAEIVAAVLEARKLGYEGSIGDAMTQQLTVEQRLEGLRNSGGHSRPAGAVPALMLPTDVPVGITAADAAAADVRLRQAIKQAKSNAAQSNS